jgi:putative restriction endonuclease
LVRRFDVDPASATEWWRIASRQAARIGDRVYLFKQGDDPRGIFGVGNIVGGPETRVVQSDNLGPLPRALIRFERLVDPSVDFLLRLEEIDDVVPPSLITAQASGNSVSDEIASEIERRLIPTAPPLESSQADSDVFDPDSINDARERSFRAIRIRRGQLVFRAALLSAYNRRCVITGCAIVDVLEAAHITPYMGPMTNDVSNGLLMRSDLHTLFACDLLAIHPETRRVVIADALKDSSYARIADRRIRLPIADTCGPSTRALQKRFAQFEAIQRRLPVKRVAEEEVSPRTAQ